MQPLARAGFAVWLCASAGTPLLACGDSGKQSLPEGPPDATSPDGSYATDGPIDAPADAPHDVTKGDAAPIVDAGGAGILLVGTIVTPDTTYDGEVLVQGDQIACAQPGTACEARPGAASAVRVDTQGVIAPGLVDTHNHILFDVHDETDWYPAMLYTNHNQWTVEDRYTKVLDTIQCLASETGKPTWCPSEYSGSGNNLRPELDKWGELKAVIAGTTSVVALAGGDDAGYGSLARTIDTSDNGLALDQVYTSALFPPGSSADGACSHVMDGSGKAYLIHCGEGLPTDSTAAGEFDALAALTTTSPGCFVNKATTVTHGVAFTAAQFATMAQDGMKLTWSPQSNVSLYGTTADIPTARAAGVLIALGPDWSMGGSVNMLDEMRFADSWDNANWGDSLTSKDLVVMATENGAIVTSYGDRLGQIAEGYLADLFVVPKTGATPYDAILAAKPKDVRLTMVGGVALYGDPALQTARIGGPPCETLDVCGASKFLCVALASSTNKLNQTYAQIQSVLETAIEELDSIGHSEAGVPYTFAPIAPLTKCN
ncbi:MAG TPA: amidohydrolase family protein [Polyangiaceae bacterium]|nr:amidohydrolase family protein [Polyangiaceae bacterium]